LRIFNSISITCYNIVKSNKSDFSIYILFFYFKNLLVNSSFKTRHSSQVSISESPVLCLSFLSIFCHTSRLIKTKDYTIVFLFNNLLCFFFCFYLLSCLNNKVDCIFRWLLFLFKFNNIHIVTKFTCPCLLFIAIYFIFFNLAVTIQVSLALFAHNWITSC
jgi:hypothetical protein